MNLIDIMTSTTSSTNGLSTMNKKSDPFKSSDICEIIKACSQAGVREFNLDGLSISFVAPKETAPIIGYAPHTPELSDQMDLREEQVNKFDEVAFKERQLEQMLIEDPDAYFDAIRRGDNM